VRKEKGLQSYYKVLDHANSSDKRRVTLSLKRKARPISGA
jgi:hypothetical protein